LKLPEASTVPVRGWLLEQTSVAEVPETLQVMVMFCARVPLHEPAKLLVVPPPE